MSSEKHFDRRQFLIRSGTVLGAGALVMANPVQATAAVSRRAIKKGSTVLFQGDSITDAGRSRPDAATPNKQPGLGSGYAWFAAAELLVDRPSDELRVFNRGISGNKVFQLAERWQADCLDLKPDLLSILIGVNDIWHTLSGNYNGTVEVYERDYQSLIAKTRESLPKLKLVICEPFVLRCGAVKDNWFPEFDRYRAAAKRVAQANKAIWVPFQSIFDQAIAYAPPEHWAADGVHPTAAGASLMAHGWLTAVAG